MDSDHSVNTSRIKTVTTTLEGRIDEWLRQPEIGLRFDPFRERDSGSDPKLIRYLIDHEAFEVLWGDWPGLVAAPAGGGKTAFRVWLVYACRVRQDGRRIFPITITALEPESDAFETIVQSAASELFIQLIHSPTDFLTLERDLQLAICKILLEALPEPLAYRLNQVKSLLVDVEKSGDWGILTEIFDPAWEGLFSPPAVSQVRELINTLESLSAEAEPAIGTTQDASARFAEFTEIVNTVGYGAVYILVDGVDAYPDVYENVVTLLSPFFTRTEEWNNNNIYVKYFLPSDVWRQLQREPVAIPLTNLAKIAIIEWTPAYLYQVISQRLLAASEEYRAITSLDALCTPALRGVEKRLLHVVRPFPRDVVMLVEQLFIAHVQRVGPHGRLEPEDLGAAIQWYKRFDTLF